MQEPTYKFPEAELATPIGTVRLWSTGADHVGVSTDGPRGSNDRTPITIRNLPYFIRLDLHPQSYYNEAEKDSWRGQVDYPYPFDSKRYGTDTYDMTAVYMHRADKFMVDASGSAQRKALEVLVPLVNEFLETEDGRALLQAGARERGAQRYATARQKYEEAAEALEAARLEMSLAESGAPSLEG